MCEGPGPSPWVLTEDIKKTELCLTKASINGHLTNALAAYTDTTTLNTLLAAKQDILTASAGISIAGATSHYLFYTHTHRPTARRYDTDGCYNAEFCFQ